VDRIIAFVLLWTSSIGSCRASSERIERYSVCVAVPDVPDDQTLAAARLREKR
jgi:hypothetical protein